MESEEQVFITCEDCDLLFSDIKPFQQHIKCKKHHKQINNKEKPSEMKTPDGDEEQEKKDSNTKVYFCTICQMTFTGCVPYTQHNKSHPHAKALRKKNDEDDPTDFKEESDSELQIDNDIDPSEIVKEIVPEPFGECFICNKKFSGPEVFTQHMWSKSHAIRKSKTQLLKKLKSVVGSSEENDKDDICKREAEKKSIDEGQEELECQLCKKGFTCPVAFAQHMTSRSHVKEESRKKLLEELKVLEVEDNYSSSDEDQQPLEVLTCEICNKAFYGPENAKAHFRSKAHKKVMERKNYLEKKDKLKEGNAMKTSLTTEVINSNSSVNSEQHVGTHLSAEPGNASTDELEVKPSAPPLPDNDEEYQDTNDQTENEKGEQDKKENSSSIVSAKVSKSLSPDLPTNTHDAKTPTEESSVTSVDVTPNSDGIVPLKESSTAKSSLSEVVTVKRRKSKRAKVKSDERKNENKNSVTICD